MGISDENEFEVATIVAILEIKRTSHCHFNQAFACFLVSVVILVSLSSLVVFIPPGYRWLPRKTILDM